VALERIDVIGPEPAERSQPVIQLLERIRLQPVETALQVLALMMQRHAAMG
jgi:hypothetical protein